MVGGKKAHRNLTIEEWLASEGFDGSIVFPTGAGWKTYWCGWRSSRRAIFMRATSGKHSPSRNHLAQRVRKRSSGHELLLGDTLT